MMPMLRSPQSDVVERCGLGVLLQPCQPALHGHALQARVGRQHDMLLRVAVEGSQRGLGCGRLICSASTSTSDCAWETRVVVRSSTGVSNCSLISRPMRIMSTHSWLLDGSSSGTLANLA